MHDGAPRRLAAGLSHACDTDRFLAVKARLFATLADPTQLRCSYLHAPRRVCDDRSLPLALQVKDPASGDFYYYNKKTGVTQWEAPPAPKAAAAKAASPAKTAKAAAGAKFDVKEFEKTGRIVPLEDQGGSS